MIRKLALLGLATYAGKKILARSSPSGKEVSVGHAPIDLDRAPLRNHAGRADPHFRPDPHGPVPPEDLEGLRPVTVEPSRQPFGVAS